MAAFKVAFVQEGDTTQHGIMALSAVLKGHGFLTDIFSLQIEERDIVENMLRLKPDIIACSAMTPGFQKMMMFINAVKQRNKEVFTIMGGPHATFYPEIIFQEKNLDAICRGEGEHALLELALSLQSGKVNTAIENLWLRRNGSIVKNELRDLITNLDTLPFPDREVYFKKYSFLSKQDIKFNIGRGCPFLCSYCFNKGMMALYKGKGSWVRFKTNERMIEEIKEVNRTYPIEWVSFNDDTFNIDKNRLKEFLKIYKKEINIPFLCQLRMDLADEEQVLLLKRAGVDKITVAIEHGDESFRKKMLSRPVTNKQILDFGKWVNKRKIRLHITNIMGFPEETLDMAFSTIELNAKLKPELTVCGMLSPYPGTDIHYYAKNNGYLREDFDFNRMTGQKTWSVFNSEVRSEIKNEYIPQMMNLRCFFALLVLFPWLKPFIKTLIKLPYNRVYEVIWQMTGPFKVAWRFADGIEKKRLLKRLFIVLKK